MKFAFDFAENAFINILHLILTRREPSAINADVVITESVEKVYHYLQKTDKKVIQIAFDNNYPMIRLVLDYPNRLRVVDLSKEPRGLLAIVTALDELESLL